MSSVFEGKQFIKISELDLAVDFVGADEFVFVQNGTTLKLTGQSITDSVTTIGNLASKGYVDTLVDGVVDSAPGTLNTLRELAFALNDDENFASHIIALVNGKVASSDFASYFDSQFAAKNTYHLAEGSNLYFTEQRVRDVVLPLIPTSFVTSYNDLTDKPVLFSGAYTDLTGKPTLFSGSYNDLTNKPVLFSGAYTDLTGKPTIPTDINQLTDSSSLLGQGGSAYTLPTATTSVLGGIKVGSGLSIANGVLSVTATVAGGSFTSLSTTDLTVQNVTFSGSGAVALNSNNDLNINAVGSINLGSITSLPSKTRTQLASILSVPAGSIAYCSNATGGACPVWFNGTSWLKLADNGAI